MLRGLPQIPDLNLMERLLLRKDFLAAARSPSRAVKACVVQMRARDDAAVARVGFTVTKKLGNAVTRNRIRRRLKEAVRTGLAGEFQPGRDYVIIGRAATGTRDFDALVSDIRSALDILHGQTHRSPAADITKGQERP
jgi:ribonuclease P protein component